MNYSDNMENFNFENLDILSLDNDISEINRTVIRLSKDWWSDNRGTYKKISVKYLKRKCVNFNWFEEDVSNGGPEMIDKIINLDDVKSGIYEVITCNESRDWESGYIDDYDYKLIPYKEK